uniref:Neurotoxin LmNaTx25 n=1 Tax=Lychas mucronatus TaxID=172552 RepID=A0A0U1TY16_LYCMC|nr:neurotoxin LmNaTx25 precursor [Lychas mucronatus]
MNIKLFCSVFTLISLVGLSVSDDVPGNYPMSLYGNKYSCGVLGENEYCRKICKSHGVNYGYCFNSRCWCEYLEDKDVDFWAAHKNHCKNDKLYPPKK